MLSLINLVYAPTVCHSPNSMLPLPGSPRVRKLPPVRASMRLVAEVLLQADSLSSARVGSPLAPHATKPNVRRYTEADILRAERESSRLCPLTVAFRTLSRHREQQILTHGSPRAVHCHRRPASRSYFQPNGWPLLSAMVSAIFSAAINVGKLVLAQVRAGRSRHRPRADPPPPARGPGYR